MKTLVIVESPSKCKKIEDYLGSDYKVVASCGHITSFSSLEQFNEETYDIHYKVDKPKIVSMLKKEIKQCKGVIIATDDDREGEAIGWHICQQCKLSVEKTPRILFSEITKQALQYAIQHPTYLNIQRIYSQQTRQLLDLYIGFTISPLLWKYILNKLSAGRCQTPALHMLYEKEKEFDKQSDETHFKIVGTFTSKEIIFYLSQYLEFKTSESLLELCKSFEFKLEPIIETKKYIEKRPNILITNTLQQKSHQLLHMSPKQTMDCAQILYENGLITYMRSDCEHYNDDFKYLLEQYIHKHYGESYVEPIISKEKKAHEGIRVTDLNIKETSFENKYINKLYDLIYHHTLQSSMSDCEKLKKTFKMKAPMDYEFIYNENHIIFHGWRKTLKEKQDNSLELYLTQLRQIHYQTIEAKEQLCNPKYHYCESQLIQKLKKENIGRPSTYATILSKLLDKHYVKKGNIQSKPINIYELKLKNNNIICEKKDNYTYEEKNKLYISENGKKVIEFCYKYYEHLFNYNYTSKMETILDEIEHNNEVWKPIFKQFKKEVDKEVNIIEIKPKQKSLHCGLYNKKPVIIKKGQFGYYLEYNKKNSSLLSWDHYEQIESYIEQQEFPKEYLDSICQHNDFIVINSNISIRKSDRGEYIYYKTKQMKKPKFYPLNIESRNIDDLKDYIQKNYSFIM